MVRVRTREKWETDHFNLDNEKDNLRCPHCDEAKFDVKFMKTLERARVRADIPFIITSGYRCKTYQDLLRSKGYETARGVSPHEKGVAVDIRVKDGEHRSYILTSLMGVGFNRFGIGSNFIHADKDPDRNDFYIWHYKR